MNYDRVPNSLKWMLTTSFFHAGYEALLVNELRYLQLVERKFGLDIQVPSATSKLIILLLFLLPSFLPKRLICEIVFYSPLIIRFPRASILVARYCFDGDCVWVVYSVELSCFGILGQGATMIFENRMVRGIKKQGRRSEEVGDAAILSLCGHVRKVFVFVV